MKMERVGDTRKKIAVGDARTLRDKEAGTVCTEIGRQDPDIERLRDKQKIVG
jgi:hypothetical protein